MLGCVHQKQAMNGRWNGRRGGFTLIELVVTVAVAVALALLIGVLVLGTLRRRVRFRVVRK